MNRLLSEQEICDTCPAVGMRTTEYPKLRCQPSECLVYPDLLNAANAQLAKTDKEWVAGVENIFSRYLNCIGYPKRCSSCSLTLETCKQLKWQQLKATLGGKQ